MFFLQNTAEKNNEDKTKYLILRKFQFYSRYHSVKNTEFFFATTPDLKLHRKCNFHNENETPLYIERLLSTYSQE